MRLFACLLPLVSFVFSISASGQIFLSPQLPAKVVAGKPVTVTVKGKPKGTVSATNTNGTITPATATFDATGKATFQATFTTAGAAEIRVLDSTGTWASTSNTIVTGAAPQTASQKPASPPAVQAPATPPANQAPAPAPAGNAQASPSPVTPTPKPEINQPHAGDEAVSVTPVAPTADGPALIDVFAQCKAPTGPSLLKQGIQTQVFGTSSISLELASPLAAGVSVCAIETQTGAATSTQTSSDPISVSAAAPNPVPARSTPVIETPTVGQRAILVDPVPLSAGAKFTATLDVFQSCNGSSGTGPSLLVGGQQTDVGASGEPITLQLTTALTLNQTLCAVETFAGTTPPGPSPSPSVKVGSAPVASKSIRPVAPLGMAVVGLDISGASSTSPRAVFLGTGIFDIPVLGQSKHNPGGSTDFSDSHTFWLSGLLRIAGMAQPGTLSGNLGDLGSTGTYLASGLNATPDQIVQSIEANASASFQLGSWKPAVGTFDVGSPPAGSNPSTLFTISAIASFGAITPLSASQANPPVYYLSQQIMSTYNLMPSGCTYTSGTPPCYVSFVPTDRTHFYRSYEAGLRMKIYASDYPDGQYRFPGLADLTVGQNEYVTGGKLRGMVLHLGGVMPVPAADGIYIFGSMDLGMNFSYNQENTQLLLTPVPSSPSTTLTYLSPSVNIIPVSQPNRDRYRFGFGIDIMHLIAAVKAKASTPANAGSGSSTPAAAKSSGSGSGTP